MPEQNIIVNNNEQEGGRRGWGRGPSRHWHSPPVFGLRRFYTPPVIYGAPVVTTQIREVEKPAFVIKQNVGDYCGKSDDKRHICDGNMICNNDNRCVTFRDDLNIPEQQNRVFRVCRDNNDYHCVNRSFL